MKRLGGLLLAVALLASSAQSYTPFHPVTRNAPDDFLPRARRALAERGESIETSDEEAGLLLTEWREREDGGGKTRLRWKITNDGGGFLIVDSQCEFMIKDPGPLTESKWERCGERQPKERQGEAEAIADEIAR